MASAQFQETLVQDAPVQMDSSSSHTGLNVEMKADGNATLNAPVLTNNNILGTVNINYISNPADIPFRQAAQQTELYELYCSNPHHALPPNQRRGQLKPDLKIFKLKAGFTMPQHALS
ncbi:hypothetical protein E1301_Tti017157 [Triplophysa tibetana]|uniref:Uncharacterized protein n=1 Tax=Triplophysa tibetana TaxID=1572043 RepID=A0A5A9PIF3_9TELE|nr:hypothetical protein E1301_Tti017157 [Triplophysa tibetana]